MKNFLVLNSKQQIKVIKKILNSSTIAFFVLLLAIGALVIIFFPGSLTPSPSATLGNVVKCQSDKFSQNLLSRTVEQSSKLLLLINLKSKPSEAEVSDFAAEGITLYLDSWVMDYLVGETDYHNLCKLAKKDSVTFIDLAGS